MVERALLTPISLRAVSLRNRMVVSPMCTYCAVDGLPGDFHLAHLGRFALGGAAAVFVEATAITLQGRISKWDTGLWSDTQIPAYRRITDFLVDYGSVPAIQLAHAGLKASGGRPSVREGSRAAATVEENWTVIGPSIGSAPADGTPAPHEMTITDIHLMLDDWREAARRAYEAGFKILEIHGGHGYLIHQFLSMASNRRRDQYGGTATNRMRLAVEIARAIRGVWPDHLPLFFRLSAEDSMDPQWTIHDSIALAARLKDVGVDLIDCSSGGTTGPATPRHTPRGYGFQVPYAAAIRKEAGIPTLAVGLIVDPLQADGIVAAGGADLIGLGRTVLGDPEWPTRATHLLGGDVKALVPIQYRSFMERYANTLARLSSAKA